MEHSSGRNSVQGMPRAAQGSMPPEYWNSLESMYSDPQHQSQPQPQPDAAAQQTPMGIDWNHPIFQQQQQQQPPQQLNHLAPQPESNHGIYSSIPQSWQANPLHQPARGYPVPSQYQVHQQAPPFQQGRVLLESRSLAPSESSTFPSYSYQPNYFQPHQLQVQDQFPGQPNPPNQQSSNFAPVGQQPSMSRFSVRPGYPQELLHNNIIDLTNDFPGPQNGTSPQQTINPQFLGPTHQNVHTSTIQPNLLYGVPPEVQAADGRNFNYFENAFSSRPQMGATGDSTRDPTRNVAGNATETSAGVSSITGLPQPQVVIPVPKDLVGQKPLKPKKTVPKTQKKTQSRPGSDSSDESELEIEAPDETSPLPPARPREPVAAAEYDTIEAVWSPRNKWPLADKIKGALVAFKDVIKTLRDSWKDQVQAMKAAENQGDNDKAARLKEQVALHRRTLERMVLATLNFGHPTIIEKLGEHPMSLSVFYSFLADRFQVADYDGSLTVNIFKLLARFVTVDEELLQKTNLAKILPKFVKKSGQAVKDLAKTIQDNASASTKRKQSNGKLGKEDSPAKGSASNSPSAEMIGSKRPREGESNAPPMKKMVVTSNPKDVSKASTAANGSAKPGAQNGKPASTAAPRPKANIVAPKPTSLFGVLNSASKRPGTTNAERAAAAAASKSALPAEKKEKPAAPPPKPAFSFGDLMADLSKPKETVVAKPAEDKPPETEEERAKRLRKESRRKLRVSWKPDDSLTEVRLFVHDPDEELDPGDGSRRAAGDVKGEGSVLKSDKEVEELKDDDLGGLRETNFNDYGGLSEIVIESEEQKSSNFIKRGGNQQPSSPEKAAQEQRESTTLMVFYTSPADVPASPKEPPAPDSDEPVPDVVSFGELPDHIKARQERYFAFTNSTPQVPATAAAGATQQTNTSGGGIDISNLLKIIQSGQAQPQATPPSAPQAPAQAPMSDLERTINMFRQQSQAPAQQPAQMPVAQPVPPVAGGGGIDFSQILNVVKQLQNPAASQPQQAQPNMVPNLGAMFSQMAGQNQQPGTQQGYDSYEDSERKRMREDRPHEQEYVRSKRTKANDPKPYKYQQVQCRYWAEGRCRKGDNCTYRHDRT